jgi:hypothetical protein
VVAKPQIFSGNLTEKGKGLNLRPGNLGRPESGKKEKGGI